MATLEPAKAPRSPNFWRAPDLSGAELLRARFRDHVYPPHYHETVCLGLITGGAIEIDARGRRITATRGSFVIIDAGTVHSGRPATDGGWKMRTLHLAPAVLARVADEEAERSTSHVALKGPVVSDPELARYFYGIHYCSETDGPALKREEYFLRLLMRLLHGYAEAPVQEARSTSEPAAVAAAKEFLQAHASDKVTLGSLADATRLTPFRLLRAFARATGMTPHAWQTNYRILRAQALLRQGTPPAEVADVCGFADQAHLTRAFRRLVGTTPGRYRAAS